MTRFDLVFGHKCDLVKVKTSNKHSFSQNTRTCLNMPQEFYALQCYSCETFQVQIVKKTPKWSCSMCFEKQSLKKVFAKGPSSYCRGIVQSLNKDRVLNTLNTCERSSRKSESNEAPISGKKTRWDEFIDSPPTEDVNENQSDQFTFERPSHKRRKPEHKDQNMATDDGSKKMDPHSRGSYSKTKWDNFVDTSSC